MSTVKPPRRATFIDIHGYVKGASRLVKVGILVVVVLVLVEGYAAFWLVGAVLRAVFGA